MSVSAPVSSASGVIPGHTESAPQPPSSMTPGRSEKPRLEAPDVAAVADWSDPASRLGSIVPVGSRRPDSVGGVATRLALKPPDGNERNAQSEQANHCPND